MPADLIFPHDYRSDGFTTNVTSRQAAEPDPVVRELLQNCLDAAVREAKREYAEVHFTIAQRPLSELPGLEAYRKAFKAAVREREQHQGGNTHDQQSAVERIQSTLDMRRMSVLFCRDNGVGIDLSRLQALLSEGNSNKAGAGAGSYGLGHLTAYAASDLRYVLYAGRHEDGDIASGHAILASHKIGKDRFAADGYWRSKGDVLRYAVDDGNYPTDPPSLLQQEMDALDTTGTVIAIAGFNHFHDDDPKSAFEDICRVAAINFLAAIARGRMIVHVHDEPQSRYERIDKNTLHRILEPHASQQRLSTGMSGWLVGSQAYRALETLHNGDRLDRLIDKSIEVIFRPLDANTSERSRVQVFRDGMWITNDAPELNTGAFSGVKPFDAVVLLHDADSDDHGEFYDLVRNSEGPEHRGLMKFRELSKEQRERLRSMLQDLARRLRERAGQVEQRETFTPEGFAVFDTDKLRDTTSVDPIGPPPDNGDEPITDPNGETDTDPPNLDNTGGRTGRQHTRRAPAPGKAVRLRRTVVPNGDTGTVRRVSARINIADASSPRDRYKLRMYVVSGSDETCNQPLPSRWLRIRTIEIDQSDTKNVNGAMEVEIPHSASRLNIELVEPVPSSSVIDLNVVRRRVASKAGS